MIEFFTTSIVAAWLVTAGVCLLLFFAAVNDSFAAAFWFTVIGLAALQFITIANPAAWVSAHPWAVAGCAAAYLPIGIGWSLFRWWRFLQRRAASLRSERATWKPDSMMKTWEEYVDRYMPKATYHKEEIAVWIAYWPFSVLAYALIDFLREVAEWIYARISRLYQAMSDRVKATLKDA